MKVEVELGPFVFPNFLRPLGGERSFSVANFTDEQAEAFWDDMKSNWLAHVAKRREHKEVLGDE